MTDLQIQWKRGYRKANVVSAGEAFQSLEDIRNEHGGNLRPEHVVDAATDLHHALHPMFEWDDKRAAHEHRKHEARTMIRSIEVVRAEAPDAGPVRQFQLARSVGSGNSYQSLDDVMKDPEQRLQMLNRALGELLAFRRKYAQLQELAIVFRQIDDVILELPSA